MKAASTQCAFLMSQYDRLLAGLDDRHRAFAPWPGAKTAGWLVGHLAVTGDFTRRLCRLPPLAPKEWRVLFSPGTTPSTDAGTYPPMAQLVESIRTIYAELAEHANSATPEKLAEPNPLERARAVYPTGGEFAVYLLSGHLGYHLGQLSQWRAAAASTFPDLR